MVITDCWLLYGEITKRVILKVGGAVLKRRLFLLVVAVITFTCLLTGCKKKETISTVSLRTWQDSKGNTVQVVEKPQRIVSMMLDADETIMELVPASRIAALTYLSDDPGISHIYDRSKQVKGRMKGQSAEQILSLKPDLVLIPDFWSPAVLQTLRDMKIPVYVYKTPYTLSAIRETIKEIARVVGEPEKGKELIQTFDNRLKQLQVRIEPIRNQPAKKVIAITGAGAYGARGSLYDDMCGFLHINNCQRDLKLDKGTMLPKELIVQANPDLIIVPSWNSPGMQNTQNVQEVLEDPSLKGVTAVRTRSVKALPGQVLYCINHHVADSMETLAKAVYPDLFK